MTIVPLISDSSMALRIASTAAWSAPVRSPRPMSLAAAMAPASVAATASTVISFSMGGLSGARRASARASYPAAVMSQLLGTQARSLSYGGNIWRLFTASALSNLILWVPIWVVFLQGRA
jgi:hypothetical protein